MSDNDLIRLEGLTKSFPIRVGAYGEHTAVVHAVDNVSFTIKKGETFGLVGESGSGKSTIGLTILQLHRPTSGKVYWHNHELSTLKEKDLRSFRQKMQIVFQDPYSSLNPRMTIGNAIAEPIWFHKILSKKEAYRRAEKLLSDVNLNPNYMNRYPHEFSGGQRQRICIARALTTNPDFIVADEPISALDVSVQAQIINLLQDLQSQYGLTYLFVAHDLAVVHHICDRIGVLYLGKMVELAVKEELFANPLHPYTQSLLSAMPIPNPRQERNRKRIVLTGDIPSAITPPSGCRFHTRCPVAKDICSELEPEWQIKDNGHYVACHFA